jgi:mannose-1-phosphate guanylyltransferase/phosphomannomutase
MKAMLFAAGEGQRLRPVTETIPKPLVTVAGRAMVEYPLLLLRHYGITDIMINLHHLGAQVEAHLGDGARFGLNIRYSKEQILLDTGGGLRQARSFLENDTSIVINTDVLIDLPLDRLIRFHRKKESAASLVLRPDALADRYGSIDVDDEERICRFLETRSPCKTLGTPRKMMFTGVQILEPKIFAYMESEAEKFSTTKHTYPKMLAHGEPLFGYCFDGYWQDLGTIERIKEAEKSLSSGQTSLHYL